MYNQRLLLKSNKIYGNFKVKHMGLPIGLILSFTSPVANPNSISSIGLLIFIVFA